MWSVWRRVFDLSWPVMAEQTLRTLMRTTDVVAAVYYRRNWVERGTEMMYDRGSIEDD